MTTRNQAKRQRQSAGEDAFASQSGHDLNANGTLADTSEEGVNKFLKRVGSRGSRKFKEQDNHIHNSDSASKLDNCSKGKEKQIKCNTLGSPQQDKYEMEDDMADSDWEEGSNPGLNSESGHIPDHINNISIEFDSSPNTDKRKPARRASAEEKQVAELVHRTHLLCLLGRGQLIDKTCDDPLIQASLLSLLPEKFHKLSKVTDLRVDALAPLINWFHGTFNARSSSSEGSFHSALVSAIGIQGGTPEEVAALSVALFRALNIASRFVCILDAASLKPDAADKSEKDIFQGRKFGKKGIFDSSTVMVTPPQKTCSSKQSSQQRKVNKSNPNISQVSSPIACESLNLSSKRKSDVEFDMQMQMALSATAAAGTSKVNNIDIKVKNLNINSFKRWKQIRCEESSSGVSTAVGSRKKGGPLYWAEVYFNSTGKWVHVDAVNGIIDGEEKVEAAAAACKTPLRYVVAFAGGGAKDVTRRYCAKWCTIASHRVNSNWWDTVMQPLKELESRATTARSSVEDMELEMKALTEPLPTNQQAYKSHHLYALEKWLTKYQILHPKGPVLGFCSGHPVYPRACVQMMHTKERWLREGLQLKPNQVPVKVLKRSNKRKVVVPGDEEDDEKDCVGPGGTVNLFGEWQTEPLCLPRAENGIVPKNERGQVDVWSEKCLPPGTVHLGFPRIFYVAKKLEIDYAPAMVGFEFKNGRSVPIYNGIVVCSEFKDAILQVYAEEEERKGAEERRKNEAGALARWYQLLSSIVTRQRLNNRYASHNDDVKDKIDVKKTSDVKKRHEEKIEKPPIVATEVVFEVEHEHEHVFETHDGDGDGDSGSTRIKRCHCGFSIEVEEF